MRASLQKFFLLSHLGVLNSFALSRPTPVGWDGKTAGAGRPTNKGTDAGASVSLRSLDAKTVGYKARYHVALISATRVIQGGCLPLLFPDYA